MSDQKEKRRIKSILAVFVVFAMIFTTYIMPVAEGLDEPYNGIQDGADIADGQEDIDPADPSDVGPGAGVEDLISAMDNYGAYRNEHAESPRQSDRIVIDASENFEGKEGAMPEILEDYDGAGRAVLLTGDVGEVVWSFEVENAGLYNIKVIYHTGEGTNSAIERGIRINGRIPFSELRSYEFQKTFVNESEIQQDTRGNDLRPLQVQKPMWVTRIVDDITGFYSGPYNIYFNEGENTIGFIAEREPMVIKEIILFRAPELRSYEDVLSEYEELGLTVVEGFRKRVQGQDAVLKSDSTLFPIFDRSSPLTEPYSPRNIRLNTIGGNNWRMPGQWLEWEIDVEESGLYSLGIKYRQNMVRGINVHRKITVNGEVPFEEFFNMPFSFDSSWQGRTMGQDDEPYLIFLEEGTNTIRLETVLGGLSGIVQAIEESILELNALYRQILMITGPTPDIYRDYRLEERIPFLVEILERNSQSMFAVRDELFEYTGERGSNAAIIETLAIQLESLANDPENIPARLDRFKTNVGGLSTWILNIKEQPLEIDYLKVKSPDVPMPRARPTIIERIIHEAQLFFFSFIEDYSLVGELKEGAQSIEVWIPLGRDQADVMKSLIDNDFTPNTDILVNLRLVDGAVLLPAVVAGRGPDVAMFQAQTLPINYAIRNALVDLNQFEDSGEIEKRFSESALIPYRFEGGLYGLPEQETFDMLFYRRDIMEELGLEIPETWEDVYDIIPDLQKYNLDFGVPSIAQDMVAGGAQTAPNSLFTMFLYQLGGDYYNEDKSRSILDSDTAIEAFEMWTELFISYRLPQRVNFVNRFRIGEVPLGIANYTTFNHLTVFAPEIRGLWGFAPVPGFRQEDGTIARYVSSNSSASVMIRDNEDPDLSWEFMKWWTSESAQIGFGQGMESVLGISARWPTANREAFRSIPWTTHELEQIERQWEWVRGIPEVPGGYFLSRHLDNALRSVVFEGDDPRETMLDYLEIINDEIERKRIEIGLE